MDQTARPLNISPNFLHYAEHHDLFELFQRCISTLLVERPSDPLTYLVDYLKKDTDAPKILMLGPPASGRHTIGKMLSKKLGTILLDPEEIIRDAPSQLKNKLPANPSVKNIPNELMAQIYLERIKDVDCIRRGWLMINYPLNREQALSLQTKGICPKHVICFDAADSVLIERAAGKRIDPKTKDIYHITWNVPASREIQERLVQAEENSEKAMHARLKEYRRTIDGLKDCYKTVLRTINADQPMNDVFNQAISFATKKPRSVAPRTPRIVILGPAGSGRKTVAAQISHKYDIPIVSVPTIIKQEIVNKTPIGVSMKPYVTRNAMVPDSLLIQVIRDRLNQNDCLTKGWIMVGFPRTREQAESLARVPLMAPTRIFFLNIPLDVAIERLAQRVLDPITGNRFHQHDHPPPTQQILQRVQRHPKDGEEIVQKKYQDYQVYFNDLQEFYAENGAIHVPADQDHYSVFEAVEAGIVNQVQADED